MQEELLPVIGPTEEEIAVLKKKHGELFLIRVEGDPVEVFVFKKSDRKVISATAAAYNRGDHVGAVETMAINTLVWGDESRLKDDGILTSIAPHFEEINRARVSTLKNL